MIVQNYLKNLSKHKFDIDIFNYLYSKERYTKNLKNLSKHKFGIDIKQYLYSKERYNNNSKHFQTNKQQCPLHMTISRFSH